MKKQIYSVAAAVVLLGGLGSGLTVAKSASKFNLDDAISIEQALAKAKEAYPGGRVIEAELEDDNGGLWEIKLVAADGSVHKLYLDARTGEQKKKKPTHG
ncbi:MAG TPA: PepSY domain-containing protein [Gammaproteobacteria bacterium]|nr:PepSY domain-containing protein [Gammaproteobacteria bacterium]